MHLMYELWVKLNKTITFRYNITVGEGTWLHARRCFCGWVGLSCRDDKGRLWFLLPKIDIEVDTAEQEFRPVRLDDEKYASCVESTQENYWLPEVAEKVVSNIPTAHIVEEAPCPVNSAS